MPNLFLRWETTDSGVSYRRYCTSLTATSQPYLTRQGNLSGHSFGPADIGVTRRIDGSGYYVSGASQDSARFDNIFPTDAKIYPTPIINSDGGWKYQPIDLDLPSTLDATGVLGGLVTDFTFEVSNKTGSAFDFTITSVVYDTSVCLLYLTDEIIGDGSAYTRNVTYNGRSVAGYDWRVYYGASYCTAWDLDANKSKNGIIRLVFSGVSNMPEGTYQASTQQYWRTAIGGYFLGGPSSALTNPSSSHVPSGLILGSGIGGTARVPGYCLF